MKNQFLKSLLICVSILTALSSCQNNDEAQKLLTGKWRGVEWRAAGEATQRDVQSVHFQFEQDGSYQAAFGAQQEAGKYRLDGYKLYTNAEGQAQKMVKLTKLTQDTLVMDMNRAGQEETLVLVKE